MLMSLLIEYEKLLISKGLSKNTIEIYMRCALKYEEYKKKTEVSDYAKAYLDSLCNQYKLGTVNLYIIATNKYINFLGETQNRMTLVKVQHNTSLENVISLEDYKKLMNHALVTGREKYYYILFTLAYTGIRISELKYFRVDTINRGYINITNKRKNRDIYIPDILIDKLLHYCDKNDISEGVIFQGCNGKAISREAVWMMLQKFANELGIPREKVHPHSFRHFFAKSYIKKYGDIAELADILGHSSLETTRIYTMTTTEEKRKKLNELL